MMPFGRIDTRSCGALLALWFAVLSPAMSAGSEIKLKNTMVNLRKGPSTQSEILAQLPPRARVTVVEKTDKWYKVKYCKHVEGFVHGSLVASKATPKAASKRETAPMREPASDAGTELVRQQATIAFARCDWAEVVRLLDETPGVTNISAGEGYMLGIAYRELGRFDRAEASLFRALGEPERSWDATSAEIYRQLLDIQQKRKRWIQVIDTAKRITTHLPAAPWAVKARAEAYLQLRRPAEALAEYQSMLMKNPDEVDAFVGMGRARVDLNDLRGAEADFNTAIRKAPGHEQAYLGLAELQLVKKQALEAEATLRKGVAAAPASKLLKDRLAYLEKARRLAEQRADLQKKRDQLTAKLCSGGIQSCRFTVVAKLKPKLYEIRLDSDEPAFLQTRRSVFSGPGYHEIPLIDTGEIPVRLAPRRGGFVSRARLLKELTDAQAVQYQQTGMELHDVNKALEKIISEQQRHAAAVSG